MEETKTTISIYLLNFNSNISSISTIEIIDYKKQCIGMSGY